MLTSGEGAFIRVLVVGSTLPRGEGDTEPRFVLDLASGLSKFADVALLAPGSPDCHGFDVLEGVPVNRYRYWPFQRLGWLASPGSILGNMRKDRVLVFALPFLFFATLFALVRECRRVPYDVLHLHWLFPQALCYRVASLFFSLPPAVVTVHGGDAALASRALFKPLARFATSGRVSRVTLVASHLAEHVPWLREFSIIPMGVDLESWGAVLPGSGKRVVFVGRLAKKKGVETLITSASQLDGLGYEVHIIGDGEEREALEGVASRAVFHGAMSKSEIIRFLRRSDTVCLPFAVSDRFDADGTPTVLLEMLAAGIPVVATRVPCVTNFFDESSVQLFQPGDTSGLVSAVLAVETPGRRAQMVEVGRREAQKFSWPKISARFAEVLGL